MREFQLESEPRFGGMSRVTTPSLDAKGYAMKQDFEEELSHAGAVVENQMCLGRKLRPSYDFIVCGAGSAGCVVAAHLAERHDVQVLLLETGGDDMYPTIMEPNQWPLNLGSERDWVFEGQPTSHLNGRRLPLSMEKALGGGSRLSAPRRRLPPDTMRS